MEIVAEKRAVSEEEVAALNKKYKPLSLEERLTALYQDFGQAEVMLTSSFAATSAFLLKLFSQVNPEQLVYFIDTG